MAWTPPRSQAVDGRIEGLDGIRALAIIAVLIFHLRPASLPGGYLGVDVFFVISGFLITTLLARELRKNHKIDLKRFWTRRARRLIPALVVVVTASTTLALFAGDDLLVNIGRQVVGALTFSNNWLEIGAGSSYFNQTSPVLFVNFWSLAVEEQFYLFWPFIFIVIMATTRTGRQRIGIVLGIALASALLMAVLFTPGQDSTRVYYGTDTHLFGLMIGAALAFSAASQSWNLLHTSWWQRYRVLAAGVALIGLVGLMLWMDPTTSIAYRGGIACASLLTATMLAALPGTTNPFSRFFSIPVLEWVGARSYGIYLWHWPVILLVTAFLPRALPDSPAGWVNRLLALVLTLAVAAASYRWIENPIRELGFRATGRRVVAALAVPGRFTPPRLVAAGTAVSLVLFGVALATAPDRSQVEMQMDQAAELLGGSSSVQQAGSGVANVSVLGSAGAADGTAAAPGEAAGGDPAAPEGEAADGVSADATADAGDAPTADATADPNAALVPAGEDISGIGDSMMYVAAPGLSSVFPGITLDAKSNRQWPAVLEAIRTGVQAGTVRDAVVISAGTNAGARDPGVIREALDLLGPGRRVVLVNIFGSSLWVPESNANLEAVAAEYPNVVVADWNGTISQHLDRLQPDQTHPDMDGMYLYAQVVRDAFVELASERRVTALPVRG